MVEAGWLPACLRTAKADANAAGEAPKEGGEDPASADRSGVDTLATVPGDEASELDETVMALCDVAPPPAYQADVAALIPAAD